MRRVIPALASILAVMLITSSLIPAKSIIGADSLSINPPAGLATLEDRLRASVKKDKPTLSNLYPGSLAEISRLYMLDGRTGQHFTTEDKERIDRFLLLLNSLTFKKKSNQSPSTGYRYFVDLFQGETKVLRITFAGDVQIDGTYYSVDRDIGEDLDSFYESLR